jgi:hypothetical protein
MVVRHDDGDGQRGSSGRRSAVIPAVYQKLARQPVALRTFAAADPPNGGAGEYVTVGGYWARSSNATASMCGVWGNMSTGRTLLRT